MKFIITESQHKRLLSEQKIYTSQTEYDLALMKYEDAMSIKDMIPKIRIKMESFFKGEITKKEWNSWWTENFVKLLAKITKKYSTVKKGKKLSEVLNIKQISKTLVWREGCYDKKTDKITYEYPPIQIPYSSTPIRPKKSRCKGDSHFQIDGNEWAYPEKPIFKSSIVEPIKKVEPIIPTPPIKIEPIKTNFSATFGQDGKQETRYFKNFNEWKNFYDSVTGKFGFMGGSYNNSETEASVLLRGVPSDWGL